MGEGDRARRGKRRTALRRNGATIAALPQRFDNELGDIGHCVATTLAVLQVAGCSARTPLEVHLLTKKFIGAMIEVQLDGRLDPAVEGGAS